MKCQVRRTSDWDGDDPPCPGAVREPVTYTISESKEYFERNGDTPRVRHFRDVGFNWRELERDGKTFVLFDVHTEAWTLEVSDLDSLLLLAKETDDLVIQSSKYHELDWCIEIYDDYRE